jgi:methionyl-tRNA formyltransferase
MKIAIIGRTEQLYNTALRLNTAGHVIVCIVTSKEAPEYTRTAADFRTLAETWQIPFVQGGRISEHADFLQKQHADIAVSINYTGVVPQSVIDLFPLGVLNAHGGDLPRYRGNACQAWAIINGEDRIGLCIHKMIGGELDSGDIVARDYLPIDYATKVTRVFEWMNSRTPVLLSEAVDILGANPEFFLERQSKDPNDALRCYPRRPDDGCIDWHQSALNIIRLINASNKPYPGAFCDYQGQQLIIWDAELVNDEEVFCAMPGQVTKVGEGFVEVACEEKKIRLLEVEFNGKKFHPSELIKSIRVRLG